MLAASCKLSCSSKSPQIWSLTVGHFRIDNLVISSNWILPRWTIFDKSEVEKQEQDQYWCWENRFANSYTMMNKSTAPRTELSVSLMLNKYMMLLADSTYLFTVAAGNSSKPRRDFRLLAIGSAKLSLSYNEQDLGKFPKTQSAEQWHPFRRDDHSPQSETCTSNPLGSQSVWDPHVPQVPSTASIAHGVMLISAQSVLAQGNN